MLHVDKAINNMYLGFYTNIKRICYLKDLITPYNHWVKQNELIFIFKQSSINLYTHNINLNLPLNNQKTRSKKQKEHFYTVYQLKLYKIVIKYLKLKKIKYSKNYLIFDYINRLWYKQWYDEWRKIRKKRLFMRKISFKGRTNINFPVLRYKYVIRNFKVVNKKKQKFMNNFNLGFYFYEYIYESKKINRLSKKLLRRKFSKYFIIKKSKFGYIYSYTTFF